MANENANKENWRTERVRMSDSGIAKGEAMMPNISNLRRVHTCTKRDTSSKKKSKGNMVKHKYKC